MSHAPHDYRHSPFGSNGTARHPAGWKSGPYHVEADRLDEHIAQLRSIQEEVTSIGRGIEERIRRRQGM